MIAANYNPVSQTPLFQSFTSHNCSQVRFHAHSAPLLQQWHQLISAIREKANRRQWVTLINPPFIPNDQYLREIGLGDHYVRVIQLKKSTPDTMKYIQRCVQNGKSSVVAVWASQMNELPDVLLNESPIGCQALVFCPDQMQSGDIRQMEMMF